MTGPFIINGYHQNTQPIGAIPKADGSGSVIVWSDDTVSLLAAAMEAIGKPPMPLAFGLGGQIVALERMSPGGDSQTTYQYDPSGDVLNQAIAQAYASLISAYNAQVAVIPQLVQTILQRSK